MLFIFNLHPKFTLKSLTQIKSFTINQCIDLPASKASQRSKIIITTLFCEAFRCVQYTFILNSLPLILLASCDTANFTAPKNEPCFDCFQ
jgi:hypothetical protein